MKKKTLAGVGGKILVQVVQEMRDSFYWINEDTVKKVAAEPNDWKRHELIISNGKAFASDEDPEGFDGPDEDTDLYHDSGPDAKEDWKTNQKNWANFLSSRVLAKAGIKVVAGKIATSDLKKAREVLAANLDPLEQELARAGKRQHNKGELMKFHLFTEKSHGVKTVVEVFDSTANNPDDVFVGSPEDLAVYVKKHYPKVKSAFLPNVFTPRLGVEVECAFLGAGFGLAITDELKKKGRETV